MTKKKRHHYIPRFYLKRFSVNNEGKFLGLYNLNNRKFIKNAPVKSQAYENFLYGEDDEIENALADLEGKVAQMFYYWTEEKLLYPPPLESNGFKVFQRFLLYQIFRTPKMGKQLLDSLNVTAEKMLREFKPNLWEQFKGHRIENDSIVLFALLHSAGKENLLDHLEFKFIVNLSDLPFITSDSPVILYNQLLEKTDSYVGATALVTKGLQIFYPIHPRLMICLFDSQVYECDKESINCTSTEDIRDIHQLNALQYINCNSQLFFDDSFEEKYFSFLNEDFDQHRNINNSSSNAISVDNRKFVSIENEDPHIDLELSFF